MSSKPLFYVKVSGLPEDTWSDVLEKAFGEKTYNVHVRRSYIAIETQTFEEAEEIKASLHLKEMEDKTILKAMHLITIQEGQWTHRLFPIRPDFVIEPVDFPQQELDAIGNELSVVDTEFEKEESEGVKGREYAEKDDDEVRTITDDEKQRIVLKSEPNL